MVCHKSPYTWVPILFFFPKTTTFLSFLFLFQNIFRRVRRFIANVYGEKKKGNKKREIIQKRAGICWVLYRGESGGRSLTGFPWVLPGCSIVFTSLRISLRDFAVEDFPLAITLTAVWESGGRIYSERACVYGFSSENLKKKEKKSRLVKIFSSGGWERSVDGLYDPGYASELITYFSQTCQFFNQFSQSAAL